MPKPLPSIATRRQLLVGSFLVIAAALFGVLECGVRQPTVAQRHGGELYLRMCTVCHGARGEGYAADQAPALAHPAFLASATDAFLRTAIANGRRGTTMSAWSMVHGGPLSATDVDHLVEYLRTWGGSQKLVLDEKPSRGDAASGESTYGKECVRCHGAKGVGGPNVNIGNPELLAGASNGFLRLAIRRGREGTAMPAFEKQLGEDGVENVLAYLRKLQADAAPPPPPQPAKPPPIPLGPVPLNPRGPEPVGFKATPGTTSVDVVHAELERKAKFALLDARAPSDYIREHIAGAVSVPFYDADTYAEKLPKDAWLVCYCSCPHAESGQLAQRLLSKGFTKVTVLDEGLGVWRSKQYGVRSGTEP